MILKLPMQFKLACSMLEKTERNSPHLDNDDAYFVTPSVSFYLSLDSAILHYPATNKKKRREYFTYPKETPLRTGIVEE
jgi:hypothetical protein